MCDTTNRGPGELPVTGGMWGKICVWIVRFVTGEKMVKVEKFLIFFIFHFIIRYEDYSSVIQWSMVENKTQNQITSNSNNVQNT